MRGRHGDLRLFPRLSRPQSARMAQGAPADYTGCAAIPVLLRRPMTSIQSLPSLHPRPDSPHRPQTAPEEMVLPHSSLALALELPSRSLLYSFKPASGRQSPFGPMYALEQFGSLGSFGSSVEKSATSKVAPPTPVRELRETQYLVAPGLACNFYYNLVSWQESQNSVTVAVAEAVYLWDGAGAIERVGTVALAAVCCVACSGDITVVASTDGVVAVLGRGRRVARKFGAAVQCVRWLPRENHFLAGTATGDVMCICAGDTLSVVAQMPGLTQQVCGTYKKGETMISLG